MGGLGHVEYHARDDRRRDVARRAGLDRSPRRVVHGVAVRRAGRSTLMATSRWAPARCARRRAWRTSCSRSSATPRRRDARRARARVTHAADRRCGRVGGRARPASRPARSRSPSPRRRASPAACRSSRASSRPACTRWTTLGFDVRRVVERDGHGAAAADGAERHAGDRPHQRLHPLRRPGALHRARGRRRAGAAGRRGCRRRRRPTTARRSTTSSSATTTTSTRSTRCSSARPKCG